MNNVRFRLFRSLDIFIATIITSALVIAVIKFNIFATIDGDIHLNWSYFWGKQVLEGQLFPKWFDAAFDGLGNTSFIFYPPLMRVSTLPFAILNLSPTQQMKGAIVILLLLNTYGVIKLSRLLFQPAFYYNLIAICLGIFNPFLMAEIFKRGGFPSLGFISLVPWLTIAVARYLDRPNFLNFLWITGIYSAIFLSHIPSCLILISAYTVSMLLLFLISNNNFKIAIVKLTLALLCGVFIDAFFILPIVADTHLVYQAFVPNINVIRNRLFLTGFLELKPALAASGIESVIAKIFYLNAILFLLTILFTNPWNKQDNKSFLIRLQILMVGFSLLMTTEISYPIYANIESFRKLQFPWRYLGLTSSLIPYLASYTLENITNNFTLFKKKIVILTVILAIAILNYKSSSFILRVAGKESTFINYIMSNQNTKLTRQLPSSINLEKLGKQYYHVALQKKGAPIFFLNQNKKFFPADVTDYVPKTASLDSYWLVLKRPNSNKTIKLPQAYSDVEFIQGQGNFNIKKWGKGQRILELKITQKAILNLKTFYYPGWKLKLTSNHTIDKSQQKILSAKDGRIQLKLPEGLYHVKISYRGTVAEQAGLSISIATIFLLLIIFVFKIHRLKADTSSDKNQNPVDLTKV